MFKFFKRKKKEDQILYIGDKVLEDGDILIDENEENINVYVIEKTVEKYFMRCQYKIIGTDIKANILSSKPTEIKQSDIRHFKYIENRFKNQNILSLKYFKEYIKDKNKMKEIDSVQKEYDLHRMIK